MMMRKKRKNIVGLYKSMTYNDSERSERGRDLGEDDFSGIRSWPVELNTVERGRY